MAALRKVKVNKATGPDDIPAWILRDFADELAAPLASIYNSSLREGVIPDLWKTAIIVPVPKKHPPRHIEKDLRPISLTPIVSKVFESLVLRWVDKFIQPHLDLQWYEAIDSLGTCARVLLLD